LTLAVDYLKVDFGVLGSSFCFELFETSDSAISRTVLWFFEELGRLASIELFLGGRRSLIEDVSN
jgi:hypothetical protein